MIKINHKSKPVTEMEFKCTNIRRKNNIALDNKKGLK